MGQPQFIPLLSLVQVLVHYFKTPGKTILHLQFDPTRRYEIWRFFTPALVHTGQGDDNDNSLPIDLSLHLWSNIFYQLWFGLKLESKLGWKRTAVIYFTSALFGSLTTSAFKPCTGFGVGASDAAFGLAAANLAGHFMMGRRCSYFRWKSVWLLVGNWILEVVLLKPLFLNLCDSDDAAHFGGLVGGFLAGLCIIKPKASLSAGSRQTKFQKVCRRIFIAYSSLTILSTIYYTVSLYNTVFIPKNLRDTRLISEKYESFAGAMCSKYWYNDTSIPSEFNFIFQVIQRNDPNELQLLKNLIK